MRQGIQGYVEQTGQNVKTNEYIWKLNCQLGDS